MEKQYMTHEEVTQLLKDGYDIRNFTSRKAPSWHKKVYYMWKSMWRRCYDPTHPRYQNYKDVIIADDFKLFSNYLKWIQSQSRFEEFCSPCNHIRFSIDKDAGGGHYFPHMMVLTTTSENGKERMQRLGTPLSRQAIIGISLDYHRPILLKSMFEGNSRGFSQGNIWSCLQGHYKQHKGYKWYYVNYKHGRRLRYANIRVR